jgi:hypothetical protein
MLTRRTFLKALALGTAGLALPAAAAEALVAPERRLWALDGTMLGRAMAHDRDGWHAIFSDQQGGMGEYPCFDAGPPNVAKVPLWVEIDGRRLPVARPVVRTKGEAFPRARGALTAAEIAAFRHINRLAIATFEPGVATVINRPATP